MHQSVINLDLDMTNGIQSPQLDCVSRDQLWHRERWSKNVRGVKMSVE